MDYKLLICTTDKQWMAIDINVDGKCDRISFNGNEALPVKKKESVVDFCEQILNYYNMDTFCDVELSVKIVMISEYSNLILDLFEQLKGAKSINVIDAKSIIPIYILKNCIVRQGSRINVNCFDTIFTFQVDKSLLMSYIGEKAGNEIAMEPEYFSTLFEFDCGNLIFDEKEIDNQKKKFSELKKKFDELENAYIKLKERYEESENAYIQLENEVEKNKSRLNDRRYILGFSSDNLEITEHSHPFCLWSSNNSSIRRWITGRPNKISYICKLLKSDGEVVKKGTSLIKIMEKHDDYGTGRECIIKANEDGRIFYLVKNGDIIEDNEAVILLSDVVDCRDDIIKWYKKKR